MARPLMEQIVEPGRTVITIRHFETPMNEADLARGWSDSPIDEDNFAKAQKLGKDLQRYHIDGLIASDLLRTLQTAANVSLGSEVPILRTTNTLHTWNIGKYTGEPTADVDPILEKIAVEQPEKTIEGGESFDEFKYRFLMGLIGLLNEHPGQLLGIVTHGRNLACLRAWEQMGYPDDLELDPAHLGYDEFGPGSTHAFTINSRYLR